MRAHGRYGKEHDDELLLAENGMADESVEEPTKATTALFDESAVVGKVVPIDCQAGVSDGLPAHEEDGVAYLPSV